jgi:imidazolonepropionase-like amidohydrolase
MHAFPRARLGLAVAASFAIALAPTQQLTAQTAVVRPPSTYAITDAKIVPVSGPTIERGTIVIRDGLIVAVGAAVRAPADARIVDGTGLTVYPGLIDAYSTLGLRTAPAPAGGGGGGGGGFGQPAPTAPAGAANSRNPVGLRPEVRAVDQLATDADFSAAMQAGFTTINTAPFGRIYEGQSALINLRSDDFGSMAVRATVGMNVGFQSIGGGQFPVSLIGVFAAIRQSLLDAQHYRDRLAAHTRNPRGSQRPAYDPSLEALQPVIAGTMPVVFRASSQREIERALDLAREFRLRAIIAGGAEAYRVADRLKADNVPVLLSINFPRVTVAPAADAEPEPVRVLRDRVQAPKTPGQLSTAGVRFAMTSGGSHGEFLANLRRAVAGGLSQDAAIRALTLGTAEILGAADRLGSLEVGKIANLTVVRGDIFAADARVAAVYVDGRPTEFRAPAATAGGARGPANRPGAALAGTWNLSVELEGEERYASLQLRTDDDRVRGTLQGDLGVSEIVDVKIDGDEISFSATVTLPEGTEEAWFRGTLDGGVFTGRVEIIGHANGRFGAYRTSGGNSDQAQSRRER